MVADELAVDLVRRHLPDGASVLDPFCGSGRLLAAAERASVRVGLDANPLAWLLTTAKLADADADTIANLIIDLRRGHHKAVPGPELVFPGRQVDWFSPAVLHELGRIVAWINAAGLAAPELYVVASALSATVREVSYARQSGWKLHRLALADREKISVCPWQRLERRLNYCVSELKRAGRIVGTSFVTLNRVGALYSIEHPARELGPYDVVLTSPPYGDSRTTVQYGAASALCLSIVSRIDGLGHLAATGGEIDAACLGGRVTSDRNAVDLKRYWAGARQGQPARGIVQFLSDYERACEAIAQSIRPGGKAVFVVGRRSLGGHRLRLDEFTIDNFAGWDFELMEREVRNLQQKRVPRLINRFGRSHSPELRQRGSVITMGSEIILVLRKRARPHRASRRDALSV